MNTVAVALGVKVTTFVAVVVLSVAKVPKVEADELK